MLKIQAVNVHFSHSIDFMKIHKRNDVSQQILKKTKTDQVKQGENEK